MFDIYSVIPVAAGHLKASLVAGNYKEWTDVLFAIHVLQNMVIKRNLNPIPVFVPQVCTHRKTTNHFKTLTTHTAPMTDDELSSLLPSTKG